MRLEVRLLHLQQSLFFFGAGIPVEEPLIMLGLNGTVHDETWWVRPSATR